MLTALAFAAIIILLILVHELGHFITAKLSGVKVEEFGFGLPPRMVGVRWGETIYSLNWLPLGGFVKMLGEEDPSAPRSLASKSVGTRLLVLSAGSLMNALLPFILFSVSLMIPRQVIVGDVRINEVMADSPAARVGLQAGDIITSVDNATVRNTADLRYQLQLNLGNQISLGTRRDGTERTVSLVPRWNPPEGQGAIGISIGMANSYTISESYPVWRAVPLGVQTCWNSFVLVKNEIVGWFVRRTVPQVAGPVGIVQITGEVAKRGFSPLFEFAAFLSINLGIINLFPIPALDGGRIAFVLLEWLRRGKRISPKIEGMMHLIGFALLIAAMLAVTYQDIIRIVGGDSLIP